MSKRIGQNYGDVMKMFNHLLVSNDVMASVVEFRWRHRVLQQLAVGDGIKMFNKLLIIRHDLWRPVADVQESGDESLAYEDVYM